MICGEGSDKFGRKVIWGRGVRFGWRGGDLGSRNEMWLEG